MTMAVDIKTDSKTYLLQEINGLALGERAGAQGSYVHGAP